MKKYLALALCALTFASFGATLQTVNNLQPGSYELKGNGKITSVDVFSAEATGTVKIDRVFSMEHFTNCYDTTSAIVTNVVETKHYDDVFYRQDGVALTNCGVGSYGWNEWRSSDTNRLARIWCIPGSLWGYDVDDDGDAGGPYEFMRSADTKITDDYLRFGTGANATEFSRASVYRYSSFSTNVVTVVTTNSVTPVKAYDLTITNSVLNGTCSGGAYHGAPSDGVWLYPGDKLNFSGTAVGGTMRVVIE